MQTLRKRVNGEVEALRSRLERARARIRRPAAQTRARLAQRARSTWRETLGSLHHTLGLPTREDIERLGDRLADVQQRLDRIARQRGGGRRAGDARSRRR